MIAMCALGLSIAFNCLEDQKKDRQICMYCMCMCEIKSPIEQKCFSKIYFHVIYIFCPGLSVDGTLAVQIPRNSVD